MRARICRHVLGNVSVMHVCAQQRRRIHHCCNRGQRCPACLWETESQWPGCNRHSDSVLTESKGRDPLLAPVEWSEAPGPVSNTERGDRAPERGGTEEASNGCPHVSDCCFRLPRGELEGHFEDSGLISTHMLPSVSNWGIFSAFVIHPFH